MAEKEKLCPNCQTGLNALRLDPREPMCVYMFLYSNGNCKKYVPICGGGCK